MRVIVTRLAIVFGVALTVACGGPPPSADVDAARGSVDNASANDARRYAPDSYKAAENARTALDDELKAQDNKWFKSYDKARDLAAAAKSAGDKAAADALAGKEKADTAARAKAAAVKREAAKAKAVRVGGNVRPPVKVKDVTPVYPAIAKSARVSGAVVIDATVGTDGKVVDTKVVRSVPLLDQAAVDAVQQWQYMPSLLDGVPTPVVMRVTVNFTHP
ncbi:MAG TPA: TonB family protein [Vicinamibacterales bacterium]|jgi:protein TonB